MKTIFAAATLTALVALAGQPAQAENGRNALAIAGGVAAGALLGSALSHPAPPPPVAYEEEEVEYVPPPPRCRMRQEPLFDRFGNVVETRTVRSCR